MLGLIFVIIGSAIYPFIDVFKKKATSHYSVGVIFWMVALLQLPLYILLVLILGIPEIDRSFWIIVAINTPLLITSNVLLIKDEKIAPLSTILPLLSFTPVFLIFTSYFFLGELPNAYGVIGIFLVVVGALLLKGEDLRNGLRNRLRHVFGQRASIYILIIAFIWSFSANFVKMAAEASSVWFYLAVTVFFEALFMTGWMAYRHRGKALEKIRGHIPLLVGAAVFSVIADVIFLFGLEHSYVSYAIAIKRAFLIVGSICLGAAFFRERNIRYRIGGALVMAVGILFILVFGELN